VSQALARARDRFEATPRSLDNDELTRIARGDRGCLGDLLSGLGAVALVTTVILGAMETISFSWTYVAVAVWIGGFVWGTVAQTRSGKLRKAALESGPLVLAVVMRDEPWLRRLGKRVGRAVVLFSTDSERRFDRDWLEQLAGRLEAAVSSFDEGGHVAAWIPLRALLADPESFGVHAVPSELFAADEREAKVFLASMIVHPEWLEGGYLGAEDDREAGEQDRDLDTPNRPPTLAVIVDPEHGFIEQVPYSVRTPL
jgi:hypothetical protein